MGHFHRLVVPELVQPLLKSSRLALASQIHKWFCSSPWNAVCVIIFILVATNAIVTWIIRPKDSKDDKTHPKGRTNEIIQFTFLLCAAAVGLHALSFLLYKILNLQDTTAKVVLLSLYGETLFVVISSYIIHFDDTYRTYALLWQGPLLAFVVGSTSFFPLQSRKEADNELCQKIKVVEKEVVELRSENDKLRKDNATSNQALGEMNIAYNEQITKINVVEGDNELSQKIKVVEKEVMELRSENDKLRKDNATSNQALGELYIAYNEQTKKMNVVEIDKVNLEEEMKLLNVASKEFSDQVKNFQTANDGLIEKMKEIETQKTNLENESKELRNKNCELRKCLMDRLASKAQIEAQIVRMEEEVAAMKGELKVLNELELSQKSQVEEFLKRNAVMVEVSESLLTEMTQLSKSY